VTDGLVLERSVVDALFEHAREGAADGPREVCGVLAGRRTHGGAPLDDAPADRATAAHRVPNAAARPRTEYELDPEATLRTIEAIAAAGDDLIGFYHSHPDSPARPSETDRARATWTGYVYLIVSPAEDALRAWRWTGEAFAPLDVRIER
jgi:proteasome lid subunit RPN8/RPN11